MRKLFVGTFLITFAVSVSVLGDTGLVCPPGFYGTPPNCIPLVVSVPEPESFALVALGVFLATYVLGRKRTRA